MTPKEEEVFFFEPEFFGLIRAEGSIFIIGVIEFHEKEI
jgi:hypothetical protein